MSRTNRARTGLTHERPGGPVEWYTPAHIFSALGVPFDLDPCSPGRHIVPWIPARRHFTKADDGLAQPWRGRVWLNPPYGIGIERWLDRFSEHRNGIALIFARTDTRWFHRYVPEADAVCFTAGRIAFVAPSGAGMQSSGPGCGSLLLAYGSDCVEALRRSGLGLVGNLRVARQTHHLTVRSVRGARCSSLTAKVSHRSDRP